ncbi:MAG: AraC family transcriptional regulator [Butyrivibrio sp.]|nr:AraC family transcriptional regulator [Butyrivibrio sp.]
MIRVTACGHDSHHARPCNIEHNNSLSDYLALLVKRPAWFYVDGEKIHTSPNMIIIFPPDSYIHYGCDEPGYNDDWIHFNLLGEDDGLIENLGIIMCKPLYPNGFFRLSQYTQLLSDVFHGNGNHSNTILDNLIRSFIYDLGDELSIRNTEPSPKYYAEFAKLRSTIYNDPAKERNIPEMAEELILSVSYFQHLYKEYFGCSCKQDTIEARLKLARFYLSTTDMTISEISDFCGYDNELHFMRQFKKYVGCTPTCFRKNQRSM